MVQLIQLVKSMVKHDDIINKKLNILMEDFKKAWSMVEWQIFDFEKRFRGSLISRSKVESSGGFVLVKIHKFELGWSLNLEW